MKPDITHTINVLECINDIVFIRYIVIVAMPPIGMEAEVNSDRKGWPDTQILPDKSPGCAANSEIEMVW